MLQHRSCKCFTFSDVGFWPLSRAGHRTGQTLLLIQQQDPAPASSQKIRNWIGEKHWLYRIVLLIISLTSKLTSVSWGAGQFLTLVDPNYFQPSSAAHSNTESLCCAFDRCISEINWPACLCKESFTGKGIQMRLIGGSAVLSMIILWFGVTTRGKLSTKQALAAKCSVFVHSYHT